MTTDPLVNTATATDLAASGPGSTATGSDSDTRNAAVTLQVTKDDGATTYTPGGTATYTVTVAEHGHCRTRSTSPSTDALPPGVTLTANATCAANGTSSCGTVTGTTGQTSFGTTGARVDAGGANTIVFTFPVAFARGHVDQSAGQHRERDRRCRPGRPRAASDSDTLSAERHAGGRQDRRQRDVHAGRHGDVHGHRLRTPGVSDALNVTVADPLPAGRRRSSANATCVANGTSSCGTVTGTTGQTSFGTTGGARRCGRREHARVHGARRVRRRA